MFFGRLTDDSLLNAEWWADVLRSCEALAPVRGRPLTLLTRGLVRELIEADFRWQRSLRAALLLGPFVHLHDCVLRLHSRLRGSSSCIASRNDRGYCDLGVLLFDADLVLETNHAPSHGLCRLDGLAMV